MEEPVVSKRSIRWELVCSWVKHLQKQEASTDHSNSRNKEDGNEVEEEAVKGLGKQFKYLKRKEKNVGTGKVEPNNDESNSSFELEKLLSKEAFSHLKESGIGLHLKV